MLLSRTSVYLCMWGFRKSERKLQDQQRLPKKLKFLFKTCFSNKPFTVYIKESFIFPGVTGNILEEDVDLIVTEDSADHFASYESIEAYKQAISNNLFLSEFLNVRYTTSKLMSYKGNG